MRIMLLALAAATLAASPAEAAPDRAQLQRHDSFDKIRLDGAYQGPPRHRRRALRARHRIAGSARRRGDRRPGPHAGRPLQPHVMGRLSRTRQTGPVEISVGTHDLAAAFLIGPGSLSIDKVRGLSFELAIQGAGRGDHRQGRRRPIEGRNCRSGQHDACRQRAENDRDRPRRLGVRRLRSWRPRTLSSAPRARRSSRSTPASSAKIDATGTATIEVTGGPACIVKASGSVSVTGCNAKLDQSQRRQFAVEQGRQFAEPAAVGVVARRVVVAEIAPALVGALGDRPGSARDWPTGRCRSGHPCGPRSAGFPAARRAGA